MGRTRSSHPPPNGTGLRPFYESPLATLYRGRAEDVLPTLERSSVDMVATDPPYGVGWQSGKRADRFDLIEGDADGYDVPGVIGKALPALKRRRHLYLFGEHDYTGLPLCGDATLIWDKAIVGPGDLSSPWGPSHETIQFFCYEFSQANRERGDGQLTARLRQGSVLRVQRRHSGQVARHPTEKPVELMRSLIESSTTIGETVLDPFAGSGSTLVAAVLSGRKAVGVEVDVDHCVTAARRLREAERIVERMVLV